jgi:hypothetical protein
VSSRAQFPLLLMKPEDPASKDAAIWSTYKQIVETADQRKYQWAKLSKPKFVEQAKKAAIVIQTGETEPNSCLIVTKGRITILQKTPADAKATTVSSQDHNDSNNQDKVKTSEDIDLNQLLGVSL